MDFNYIKRDLPNGIKLRVVNISQSPTVTFAVLVGAGSRNETPELSGLAHFIEHNVFKGTPTLPSSQAISDAIESIGGIHNAYTGHEITGFWAKAATSKLPSISRVVSDIFLNPIFPKKDLEIERGNVIEEINMYEDNPPQKVLRDFFMKMFDGHALGRSVLGTKENLNRFTSGDLQKFRHQFYRPESVVVIVAGDVNDDTFFNDAENLFAAYGLGEKLTADPYVVTQTAPLVSVTTKELDQAHLVIGVRSFGADDPREETLAVVNEILGGPGSLSSRLFHKIRDELGLAYYVNSMSDSFKETGTWFVRAGVSVEKRHDATRAILNEFKRLTDEPVLASELARAKEHLKGQFAFSLETSDGVLEFYGQQEILKDKLLLPEEVMAKIDAVTVGDIQKLSQELIRNDMLNVTLLGPFDELREKESLSKLLS